MKNFDIFGNQKEKINEKYYTIIVKGMPDHVHAFIGLHPFMLISDLVRNMKNNSYNADNIKENAPRLVLLHGIISFGFNMAQLAFMGTLHYIKIYVDK